MMKKDFSSIVKIIVCVLFALSLCLVPSCKKSPQEPPAESSGQKTAEETKPKTPAPQITIQQGSDETKEVVEAVEETATDTSASEEPEAPAAEKPLLLIVQV
jgi:hypothetical protein